jgi:hypothetical protein
MEGSIKWGGVIFPLVCQSSSVSHQVGRLREMQVLCRQEWLLVDHLGLYLLLFT